MSYVWFRKSVWDNIAQTDPRSIRVLERSMRSVSLVERAIYENGASVQYYVWSSLSFDADDMTLLGSTVSLLAAGAFPFDRVRRAWGASDPPEPAESTLIWGVLAGSPELNAPLLVLGDNLAEPTGGEDVLDYVYEANNGAVNYTGAGVELPPDFEPDSPP